MHQYESALIVDENRSDRRMLVGALRNAMNIKEIYQAGSAREALATLGKLDHVALVFGEVQLPDLSGFEFFRQARAFPSANDCPLILTSRQRDRETLIQAASVGVSDFIVKPYTGDTLVSKLRKVAFGHEKRHASRSDLAGNPLPVACRFSDETIYETRLLNVSVGGCLTLSEIFSRGGCIGDEAQIKIEYPQGHIALNGTLIRMERAPEAARGEVDPRAYMHAAFQFTKVDDIAIRHLSELIKSLRSKKADKS